MWNGCIGSALILLEFSKDVLLYSGAFCGASRIIPGWHSADRRVSVCAATAFLLVRKAMEAAFVWGVCAPILHLRLRVPHVLFECLVASAMVMINFCSLQAATAIVKEFRVTKRASAIGVIAYWCFRVLFF